MLDYNGMAIYNLVMKNVSRLIFISFFISVLLSCATTLTVNVTRPAKLDLNGAKTISVLPFKPSDYYGLYEPANGIVVVISDFFRLFDRSAPEERRCISYFHDEIEQGLMTSPYVQLVSAAAVQTALNNGNAIPADVYLTGEIVYFDIEDEKEVVRKKVEEEDDDENYGIISVSSDSSSDKKTVKYITEEYFTRRVKMEFRYQVVDSKSNKIISYDRSSISERSSRYDKKSSLPSAYSLLEYDLRNISRKILRDLQPYVVRKSIKLMQDKSKMPAIKAADGLARDGYLKESYEQFLQIYRDTNMLVAGYNAAMILEALGRLDEAEQLIKEVYVLYPESAVLDGLYDIQSEIRQNQRLQGQISN